MNELEKFKQEMLEAQDDYKLKGVITKDEMEDKFTDIVEKYNIKIPSLETFHKLEFHNDFFVTYHRIMTNE